MPRKSTGPYLVFLEKRGVYFIQWPKGDGRTGLRSTSTADRSLAEKALKAFITGELHLVEAQRRAVARSRDTRPQLVYFIGGDIGAIKIGLAVDPEKRLIELQCGSPIPLSILALAPGGRKQEWNYHNLLFHRHRLHGEWFDRHPDILAEIRRLNGSEDLSGVCPGYIRRFTSCSGVQSENER